MEESVPLLLDAGGFSDPIAKIVELGAPYIAPSGDLDLLNDRGMQRKYPLNTNTETDFADGERFANPATVLGDYDAFEDLGPFPAAFDDPDVYFDDVAWSKLR
jgi:hypothetical protein